MADPTPVEKSEPEATGTLARKPLAHLLVYALDRKLTGTFEVVGPAGATAHVVVSGGNVARVATSDRVTYLGHVLYELGYINDETLSMSLAEVAAAKRLHGQVLLERGAITREQLAEGLRQQRARKLHHAFSFAPQSTFAFYGNIDLIGERPDDAEPVDPLAFVWRGVRLHPSWDHVRATVARVGGRPIRLLGGDVDRLGLNENELTAAECLRLKASTIPELAIIGGLTIQQTDLLAYFLVITKRVEVVDKSLAASSSQPPIAMPSGPPGPLLVNTPGQAFTSGEYKRKISFTMSAVSPEAGTIRIPSPLPPNRTMTPMPGRIASPLPLRFPSSVPPASPRQSGSGSQPPLPSSMYPAQAGIRASASSAPPPRQSPSSMPPDGELSRKKSIVDRAKWIEQEDYFKVLMVGRDAPPEEVRAAFLRAAKVWHPETLPASILDARGDCERVFFRITAAYETLVDPAKRRAYERTLDASLKDSAEADHLLSEAEMHLTLGDRKAAEESVRRAIVASPENGEAIALLAFLRATSGVKASTENTQSQIKLLDMVIAKDPMTRRAHYYRAILHRNLDQHEAAVHNLRTAVTNDPDDVEAQRELKIYEKKLRDGVIELRSTSPFPNGRKEKGLLDRFRKK